MRISSPTLALLFAVGAWCAAVLPGAAAAEENPTPQKTLAIISAVNNEKYEISATDWKLDEYMTGQISERLGTRYRVIPAAAGFNSADVSIGGQGMFGARPETGVVRQLRMLAPAETPDLYLVLTRYTQPDPLFDSNQDVTGLGVFQRRGAIGIHAVYYISLVDGRTWRVLYAERPMAPNPANLFGRSLPARTSTLSAWPQAPEEILLQQVVLTELKELLAASLDYTLPKVPLP
jgi:hypothetical protein